MSSTHKQLERNSEKQVIAEQLIQRKRWIMAIAMIIGFSVEFFLIPLPHPRDKGGEGLAKFLLTSGDSYYALVFPLVLWWWFAVFLRRRRLADRELWIAYLAFGIYLSSALRAIAITIARLMHLVK